MNTTVSNPETEQTVWMGVNDLASYLGLARSAINAWRVNGKPMPKTYKIGGAVRFKRADVDAWIEEQAE